MFLARVIPFALALGCAVIARANERPGIFAPAAPTVQVNAPSLMPQTSATSPRLRASIMEQALARARALEIPAVAATRRETDVAPAVMLEKFVVNAEKVKPVELPEQESATRRFLRTGRLYDGAHGKVKAEVDVNFFMVSSVGALPKEDARVEVAFRFKW